MKMMMALIISTMIVTMVVKMLETTKTTVVMMENMETKMGRMQQWYKHQHIYSNDDGEDFDNA